MKIIFLCSLINEISISLIEENYFNKFFLIDITLFLQKHFYRIQSLINNDLIIYTLIHINLIDQICKKLEIQLISLIKEKLIRDYDDKLIKKIIIHKLLFNLTINDYKELTVSMLIININHHEIILNKS